jgi:transcriptional regulator with XRE-family HTH domain
MSDQGKSPAIVFGESVRAERRLQGKTTRELARLAGLHASQISRLENGLVDAKVSTVVRVARALRVTVAQLIEGTGPPPHDAVHDDPTQDFVVDRSAQTRARVARSSPGRPRPLGRARPRERLAR